jgi:hypothetical protein
MKDHSDERVEEVSIDPVFEEDKVGDTIQESHKAGVWDGTEHAESFGKLNKVISAYLIEPGPS